jgi:hypothetical protein
VIGSGVRGLASAAFLKQRGYQVILFDRAQAIGGIWNRVFPSSTINVPGYAYTFHSSNHWPHFFPNRQDILDNLARLVDEEDLSNCLELNTEITNLEKVGPNTWQVQTPNGPRGPFEGVLVACGHLGVPNQPEPIYRNAFQGHFFQPYCFDPAALQGKRVTVVGSGPSALEMVMLAEAEHAREVVLVVKPGTYIADIQRQNFVKQFKTLLSYHPLLYRQLWGNPTLSVGISRCLRQAHVTVQRSESSTLIDRGVKLENGTVISSDCVIWATGWSTGMPGWARRHSKEATVITAACARCRDTRSMGFGAATIHAKVLHASLQYGLKEPFSSNVVGCSCEQEKEMHAPHILGTAWRHLNQQQARRRIVTGLFLYGLRSNTRRLWKSKDPLWARLLSYWVAPFGL